MGLYLRMCDSLPERRQRTRQLTPLEFRYVHSILKFVNGKSPYHSLRQIFFLTELK